MLASPLPPPPGGIAAWTGRMLALPPPAGFERKHTDTAAHLLHHYAAPLSLHRLGRQAGVAARFARDVVTFRPDVLHLTTSYDRAFLRDTAFITVARIFGARVILNIRGGDFQRFYLEQPPARRRRIDQVLGRCAALVPVTQETAVFLQERGHRRVVVIPNCIDIRPLAPRSPANAARWIFVGWVMPSKGIREALAAVAAVPGSTLTVVGPGVVEDGIDGAALLATECARLNITHRVTHVNELPAERVRALLREHDVFVFPTRREGFPNVVLEAMEAGLPVVASRVGAIPEMLTEGREGYLVDVGDTTALIAALQALRRSPDAAARMGQLARTRVEERYSVGQVSAAWYTLYDRIAHNQRDDDVQAMEARAGGRTYNA